MPAAFITGASSGLGECFAYALARRGFALVLVARRRERLQAVADRALELGAPRAEALPADLARRDDLLKLARRIEAAGPELDYLVNSAGFGTAGPLARLAGERELEQVDVNIAALVALTRTALPAMVARRRGVIINLASTAAFQPIPYMATYGATKAFVLSFSQAVAEEVANAGVTVLALCPGPTPTEFQQVAGSGRARFPSFVYSSADTVVEQGLKAAERGRVLCVVGALNRAAVQAARFAPRALVMMVERRIFGPLALRRRA